MDPLLCVNKTLEFHSTHLVHLSASPPCFSHYSSAPSLSHSHFHLPACSVLYLKQAALKWATELEVKPGLRSVKLPVWTVSAVCTWPLRSVRHSKSVWATGWWICPVFLPWMSHLLLVSVRTGKVIFCVFWHLDLLSVRPAFYTWLWQGSRCWSEVVSL